MLLKAMDRGRNAVGAAFLAAGLFAATGACAGTLVTQWGYSLDNGFTAHRSFKDCVQSPIMGDTCSYPNPADIDGDVTGSGENTNLTSPNPNSPPGEPFGGVGNPGFSQAWTRLEWAETPTPLNPVPIDSNSSLSVGGGNTMTPGEFTGTIFTNAGFQDTVTLTHANNTLGERDNFLWDATLTDVLQIQPISPSVGPEFTAPIITLGINFRETLNSGGPVGADDIFVVDLDDVTAGGTDFVCDINGDCTIVQTFDFDMITYQATIALESLDPDVQSLHVLSMQECAEAGAATGCVGVRTPEGQDTTFQAKFRIDALQVPEPGTIALLGLGLVGLGFARRMRKA